jgi:hypothetical protein
MVEDFVKNNSKGRPANCSAGFFRLGEISTDPFCLVAPAALALHGTKRPRRLLAFVAGQWARRHCCFERRK